METTIGLIYNKENCKTESKLPVSTILFCLMPVLSIAILILTICVHVGFILFSSIPIIIFLLTFDSVPNGPFHQTNTTEYVGEIVSTDGKKAFLISHKPKKQSYTWRNCMGRRNKNEYSCWTHREGDYAYYFDLKDIKDFSNREISPEEFSKLFGDTIENIYNRRVNIVYGQ